MAKMAFFCEKKRFSVKKGKKNFIFGDCYHIGKQDFHGKHPADGIMGEHR